MTVSIEIRPHASSLDMYGQPDKSTAYSLSGDVVISLSSSYSLFERRRAIRLLLESLIIEFEGQCELITDETGYTPFRVCSVSKELVVREAVELSNEGHEDASLPSVWSVAFSLVIPGWLPPTSAYGDCESGDAGTRYGLYASAKFLDLDEGSSRSLFSLCTAPFRSRTRVIAAPRCEVTVNRFISTLVDDLSSPSTSSTIDYTVLPEQRKDQSSSGFPYEVISKLRAAVSVPEHIDVDDDSFSLCIRLRTQDLPESECKRLRITGFEVDVEQTEHYRITVPSAYKSAYPLPPSSHQPPCKPLRDANPVALIYEVGLAGICTPHSSCTRTFSLLPAGTSGRYVFAGDGYAFRDDANPGRDESWYGVRTQVPFTEPLDEKEGKTARRLRASGQSPLFGVGHQLHISLTSTYDLDNGERATEHLKFQIPLRFAHVVPAYPPSPSLSSFVMSQVPGHSPSSSLDLLSSVTSPLTPSPAYAQSLPAYSQLYDSNGERKIDYSVPLPLYTPTAPCQILPPSSLASLSTTVNA